MRMNAWVLVVVFFMAASGATRAQDVELLPEGQTLISLSVTERERVQPDRLVAVLRIEDEHSDPAALQNRINERMEQALERAREIDSVAAATGHYNVYQYNRSRGARPDMQWRGTQTLRLQSQASAELLELAGTLQGEGLAMQQLNYQLSDERAAQVRDRLLERAIERARDQATRAGSALDRGNVEIASLEVEDEPGLQQPVMRSMAMDSAEMTAPSAEAQETEVSLTVRVRAVARR